MAGARERLDGLRERGLAGAEAADRGWEWELVTGVDRKGR